MPIGTLLQHGPSTRGHVETAGSTVLLPVLSLPSGLIISQPTAPRPKSGDDPRLRPRTPSNHYGHSIHHGRLASRQGFSSPCPGAPEETAGAPLLRHRRFSALEVDFRGIFHEGSIVDSKVALQLWMLCDTPCSRLHPARF